MIFGEDMGKIKIYGPSTYDYKLLVQELRGRFIGEYLEKIYQTSQSTFILKIGKERLVVQLPYGLFIGKLDTVNEQPTSFAMQLRKYVKGGRIVDISLVNDDRIIRISIKKGDQEYSLVLEFFSKGNLLLLDKEGRIITVLHRLQFKDRQLIPGEIYRPPPNNSLPIPTTVEELNHILTSDRLVIQDLSRTRLGIKYVKQILTKLGIDERTPSNQLTQGDRERIVQLIKDTLQHKAYVIVGNEFYLTDILFDEEDILRFDDCFSMLRYYYEKVILPLISQPNTEDPTLKLLKYQEKHLSELKEELDRYQRYVNWLNTNYDVIERIIHLYREDKEQFRRLIDRIGGKLSGRKLKIPLYVNLTHDEEDHNDSDYE